MRYSLQCHQRTGQQNVFSINYEIREYANFSSAHNFRGMCIDKTRQFMTGCMANHLLSETLNFNNISFLKLPIICFGGEHFSPDENGIHKLVNEACNVNMC